MSTQDSGPDRAETRISGRPRRASGATSSAPSTEEALPHAETQLVSDALQEVVERDIHRRMQAFAPFVIVLSIIVALASLALGGDRFARDVMLSCMLAGVAASLWTMSRIRGRTHVQLGELLVFGGACALTLCSAFYYWGVLSGALVLLPLGAFVFPVVSSRLGLLASLGLLLAHFILAALTIGGTIVDRGLIRPMGMTQAAQYLSLFITDVVAIAAYFMGRQVQFSAERALVELDRATRAAAQRGDLLAEARHDLARALNAGRAGRFTNQVIGGYRLGVVLGRGAMGEVYEARSEDGKVCAVKLLHFELVADRAYYARFVREARIAASLDVPNVVRVLDASDDEAVLPFLVFERLYGKDLALYFQEVTRMPLAEVIDLVRQVAVGLDAAHRAGIVHRDLKPQNVFRAEVDGRVVWKVLDFGVSKLLDHEGTFSQGVIVGTPQYMAPEQARGEQVDHRADLYALALITYRALTGRPPFVVSDVRALLAVTSTRMPPRPSSVAPLPRELDDVLAVALSKNPRDRFDTAKSFAQALRDALRGRVSTDLRTRATAVLERWPWDDPSRASDAS